MRLKEALNPKTDVHKIWARLMSFVSIMSLLYFNMYFNARFNHSSMQCILQCFCPLLQFSLIATASRLITLKISDLGKCERENTRLLYCLQGKNESPVKILPGALFSEISS